jgi:phosphoglycerol transferase MdoB-like AlkP superfamily enzyme
MNYFSHLRLPTLIVFTGVIVLMFQRVVFTSLHWSFFEPLGFFGILKSFLMGLRFDLAIIVMAMAPMLLVLSFHANWIQQKILLKVISFLSLIPLIAMVIIGFADIAYFGEVQRHIGAEIFRLSSDMEAMVEIALVSRLSTTVFGFLFVVLMIFFWWRIIIKPIEKNLKNGIIWIKIPVFFITLLVWLVLARGFILDGKPIDILDAFVQGDERVAQLALNAPFVVLKTRQHMDSKNVEFLSAKDYSLMAEEFYPDRQHPFQSSLIASEVNKPSGNVVVILLESWSYKYIDGLSGSSFGATPFMDELIKKSVVWDRFYASGQRSILGIQAVLTSTPVINHMPTLGDGLELNSMSRLAELAKQDGYQTLMMQTSNRRSFHVESIAHGLGFDHYYGKEDMPILRQYPQEPPRFGWDYEGAMFLESKISDLNRNSNKPIFAFLFTGTTHEPFPNPGDEFHIRPNNQVIENRYLNTLRYSDWSIEQFMSEAAKKPWYSNTTFVFTADHVFRAGEGTSMPDQFHIPLIIFSPQGRFSPSRYREVASQYDMLPTLADIMGIDTKNLTTMGRNLLAQGQESHANKAHAMVSKGELTGFIWDEHWVMMTDSGQIVDQSGGVTTQPLPKDLRHFVWRAQTASCWVKSNLWVRGGFFENRGPCFLTNHEPTSDLSAN